MYDKLKGEVENYVKLFENYFFHHRHISRSLRTSHTRFPIELPHDIVLRPFHVHSRHSRIPKTANSLWLVPNGGIYIFNLCVRSKLCLDLREAATVNFRNTIHRFYSVDIISMFNSPSLYLTICPLSHHNYFLNFIRKFKRFSLRFNRFIYTLQELTK